MRFIHQNKSLFSIYEVNLLLFSNYFERNFYRNFLVQLNDSLVVTNFFHCVFYNDDLSVNFVTQFCQCFSNLDIAYRTEDSTC